MQVGIWLATAFGLGLVHSLDVDHLCAVGSFAAHTRNLREALRFGIRWGLGHTIALLLLGALLILLKTALPTWINQFSECVVGVALIWIGVWLIRSMLRQRHVHLHWHEHDGHRHFHLHSHQRNHSHAHAHKLTALGLLHGLAGTSGIILMIPVGLTDNPTIALVYIALFGLGTICSMALFAASAGQVFLWLARWQSLTRYLRGALGVASCGVGLIWIGRTLPGLWQ